jgi:hypothetical protein
VTAAVFQRICRRFAFMVWLAAGLLPLPAAAGVRLNEIMASNTRTLQDEDGAWSDWIELYNSGPAATDLGGMFLTDDRLLKTKWAFPVGATIGPNDYLVVFASSKNRRVPGGILHTNFGLASEGEYLALVAADGVTVVSSFAPAYPAQIADVSYGPGIGPAVGSVSLVPPHATAKYHVPAAPVNDAWRGGAAFDDSAWSTGAFEFGYDTLPTTYSAYTIASGMAGNQNFGGSLGMDFIVNQPIAITDLGCFDANGNGISGSSTNIRVQIFTRNDGGTPNDPSDDTGGPALLTAPLSFTAASPGTLIGGHRFKNLTSPLELPPGSYTVVAWGFNATNSNGNNFGGFNTTDTGNGLLTFTGRSRYGTAGQFPGTVDTHLAQYGAGTFRFHGFSTTNTLAAMKNINASLLTRQTFTVPANSALSSLTLDITCDDGFVAWLNGIEIARHHAPATLLHNSTATAAAHLHQTLAIPATALQSGPNILAIQSLNLAASDSDFLLDATLTGRGGTVAMVYLTTATPGSANGTGTLANHVLISEIHCDPVDSKSQFVEFIELFNPLATPVDVSGWAFTQGVAFTFPAATVIPAGGYLVIGEKPAHLLTYLDCTGALGPWTGSLANDGEEIVLTNAAGTVIDRVSYATGFPWPTVGEDPSPSLQLIHAGLDSNLGGSWRSTPPTPGAANSPATYAVPPAIRQVNHLPAAPLSGEPVIVTAKVTDPDGVETVTLEYQNVVPGSYLRLTDSAWITAWTSLPMRDDGTGGDAVADDDIFTATVPGTIQQHRHLIRYRITARDRLSDSIRVPYPDDACPNFAWFCYNGVPAWTGAAKPGTTVAATFPAATMNKVRAWHLLSRESDVLACQYSASDDGSYRYEGAFVIDGTVYDHVRYRVKGQNSTFVNGKNKWKFKFNRGRELELSDDRGQGIGTVRTLNLSSLTEPWAKWNRGLAGLDEAAAFKLFNLTGVAAPHTRFLQLRIIDGATEANPADQYDGDLWGLYLAFGNLDNRFKEALGLPDGNLFQLQAAQNELTGQGRGQPGDLSDLNAFISAYSNSSQPEGWFRANVDLTKYSSWRAVTEAINNSDRCEQQNMAYFRNPNDGRWSIHPWDSDLLYEQLDRWGPQGTQSHSAYEQVQNAFKHPAIRIEWQNRCRELQDLLLNSDQAAKVMDEIVSFTANESPRVIPANPLQPGYTVNPGFIEVDRRMWDWHPRSNAKGIFYVNPYPIGTAIGTEGPYPAFRTLATGDFSGMLKWTKDFIATDPHGGGRLAAMAAGTVNPLTLATGETPAAIPATPTLSYAGPAGFPANALVFQSGPFKAAGGTPFAAMEWRVGEISDPSVPGFDPATPWIYEVTPVWASGILTTFRASITPPTTHLAAGHTYRARLRHQNAAGHWSHWSTPLEFTASAALPGNLATDLVITEIMYNPPEGSNLEFIELRNISASGPLNLTGVQFTTGVVWTFPDGATVAPAGYLLVVRDRAAFEAKYGTGLPIAGEYLTSSLDNGGETLTLSLGPSQPLRVIPYDDAAPWPTAPDGSGASLALIAPETNPDHGLAANWRAGTANPGATDATRYAAWKIARGLTNDGDPDGDGIPNFIEYALAGDPSANDRRILPVFTRNGDNSFTVTMTRALLADDVGWELQQSPELMGWQPVPGVSLQTRSATATTETLTLAIPALVPAPGTRFFRFRFNGRG